MSKSLDWIKCRNTLHEMVEEQKKTLLILGRRIVPTLTSEDMLQPNDYAELDSHPEFRYEEGILAGLQSTQIALQALHNEETLSC